VARLTAENVQRAQDIIGRYPRPRSALLPLLHIAQEQDGWLSEDAMKHVAELLDLTAADVFGVASFYTMFKREPVGSYLVSVCTNISCLIDGGLALLEHAEQSLGVRVGGTTPDGMFTLEEAECLAGCGGAPCVQVNYRFFESVKADTFDYLIGELRSGRLAGEVPAHGDLLPPSLAPPVAPMTSPSPADGR
jgi:NADH-quinone oxidoreductase subunit E